MSGGRGSASAAANRGYDDAPAAAAAGPIRGYDDSRNSVGEIRALADSVPAARAGTSLTDDVARTFKGGQFTTRTLDEDLVLRRVYGGSARQRGHYWSQTSYSSPGRAKQYLSLPPGNIAESVAIIRVPAGTTIHEGQAAANFGRVGGGNQVYIDRVDPSWIVGH